MPLFSSYLYPARLIFLSLCFFFLSLYQMRDLLPEELRAIKYWKEKNVSARGFALDDSHLH